MGFTGRGPNRIQSASSRTCLLVTLALLCGCDAKGLPKTKADAAKASVAAPDKPMTGIFAAARKCLTQCKGIFQRDDAPSLLPYEFKDLYQSDVGGPVYDQLVRQLPPAFAGLSHKNENDPDSMELEGNLTFKMAGLDGMPLYIYQNTGFPAKIWVNDPETQRRPSGFFTIVIDPLRDRSAGIFIGESNLDKYWFVGDPDLLASLLAYIAADDTETIVALSADAAAEVERPALPVHGQKAQIAERRLRYLNNLYVGGRIVGALSPFDIAERNRGEDPQAKLAKQWWVVNSAFTNCHLSGGPAEKLDQYVGFTDRPRTQDFRDASGKLQKVEVIVDSGGGIDLVTTFYKSQAQCQAEQVNYTRNLADQYR